MDGPQNVPTKKYAETRDRTGDLQIFGLTLSQLNYRGFMQTAQRFLSRRSARMWVLLGQTLAFHVEQSQNKAHAKNIPVAAQAESENGSPPSH